MIAKAFAQNQHRDLKMLLRILLMILDASRKNFVCRAAAGVICYGGFAYRYAFLPSTALHILDLN